MMTKSRHGNVFLISGPLSEESTIQQWIALSEVNSVEIDANTNKLLSLTRHINASVNQVSIGSNNGYLPVWRKVIFWTNDDISPTTTLVA